MAVVTANEMCEQAIGNCNSAIKHLARCQLSSATLEAVAELVDAGTYLHQALMAIDNAADVWHTRAATILRSAPNVAGSG